MSPTRRDVIVKDAGVAHTVVFIDAPASEDVLQELTLSLHMRFWAFASDDFVKRNDGISGVALVVICPKTELDRRQSLRAMFASVRKAKALCGTAPIMVLLPLRDQLSENDLTKYGCTVARWEGFAVSRITALMKQAMSSSASEERLKIEFETKNRIRVSNVHGSSDLALPGGRPPLLLRKLLEEDRPFSRIELARTLDCEPNCIKMSICRLNEAFTSIPESLCLTLEVRSAGYGNGYQLVIEAK
jgi:hypothetical protein